MINEVRIFKILGAVFTAYLFAGVLSGEDGVVSKTDSYLSRLVEEGRFSGTVLVARGGEVLFEKSYGLADVSHAVPASAKTRYKIFSTTKPLTAAGILLLVQENRVGLTKSICEYIDNCPAQWRPVEIRHLLSHTSGIPDFTSLWAERWDINNKATLAEIIEELSETQLQTVPGATWSYSNTGYELLGCVIENVSGVPYPEFMEEKIFLPLQMHNTGVEQPADIAHPTYRGAIPVSNLASGYNGQPKKLERSESEMYKLMAAGGIYSTPRDLFKFARALLQGNLLTETNAKAMMTPLQNRYGFGWVISEKFGRQYVRHDGGNNGFVSTLDLYPGDDVIVVITSNFGFIPMGTIRSDLAAIAVGEPLGGN